MHLRSGIQRILFGRLTTGKLRFGFIYDEWREFMIETTIPELDVEALMKRVRDEAQQFEQRPVSRVERSTPPATFHLPPLSSYPAPPSGPPPAPPKFESAKVLDQLRRAAKANTGPGWLPRIFRNVFRRQRAVNQRLLEATTALARATAELSARVAGQEQALRALSIARASDVAWMRAAAGALPALAGALERNATQLEFRMSTLDARLTSESSFVKGELSYYRAAVQRLSEGLSESVSPARETHQPELAPGMFDAFYVSLEDRFRGSREAIRERLQFYLPFVRKANGARPDRPLLDIGCGRGEWLQLLRDEGCVACGVDLNQTMQAHCEARGLDVTQADAVKHLRSLPDNSLGAVTGFHVIEHLPFDTLMVLLAEVNRVLARGGIAIFESPNCKNLAVGASTFYLDPTHRNPVYPETAELMLSLTGFTDTHLHYLTRSEGSPFKRNDAASTYLDDRFFGPQDFGVIGYKPGEG